MIVSDGDRVLQIVDNLLSNAFRATPDGGRIGIELGQTNGTIRVAVEDTGPGIARRPGRAALPAVRLGRRRRHRARARRSPASSRTRSAGRSSSTPSRGAGRASSCSCPRARRCRLAGAGVGRAERDDVGLRVDRVLDPVEPLARAPFHCAVIRSIRSARSSTRACRSISRSVSSRSSRRIIWFERPLTSASRREIGAASSRRPSRSALPTASGRTTWSSSAVCASASTWSRARSSAAAMSGGSE